MAVGLSSATGQPGNGQITAKQGSLQNVVVTVVCTAAVTGAATLALDSQLGDNNTGFSNDYPNPDTSFAIGAVALTGFTLPTALNASASFVLPGNHAYRALRLNYGVGTLTVGAYKLHISAEDWKG